MTAKTEHGADLYLDLVRRFPLRPIRSDEELERAIAVVDGLTDRDDRDEGESDYLFVLGDLIRRYEEAAHPIPPAGDADVLRLLMGWRGINQSDLATATKIPVSTISVEEGAGYLEAFRSLFLDDDAGHRIEELRLLDEAMARDVKRPARDRFKDMVAHGVVDASGQSPMGNFSFWWSVRISGFLGWSRR